MPKAATRALYRDRIIPLSESARPSQRSAKESVYRGVTLIKAGLGNRKDRNFYPADVLKNSTGLFEGLRAYVDHPDSVSEEIQPERTVRDLAGIYENARWDDKDQSVKADLRILKSHRWLADTIDELLQIGHGDKIGLSINGQGQTTPDRMHLEEAGGDVDVNRLQRFVKLRSTDIVTEAGAGGGFPELLESARAASLKETGPMNLLAAIKEATEAGDLDKVKALLDGAEKPGKKATKEMGAYHLPRKKKLGEADVKPKAKAKVDDAETEDDEESETPNPDAELDDALEASATDDGDPTDEGDDEADDTEEADADTDEDETEDVEECEEDVETEEAEAPRPVPPTQRDLSRFAGTKATQRFKAAREASISGGHGKPSGKVRSGTGSFLKTDKDKKRKKSIVPQKPKQVFRESAADGDDPQVDSLRRMLAAERRRNAQLAEAVRNEQSLRTARRLLKESGLPSQILPLMVDDLRGRSEKEQQRIINRQVRLFEAQAEAVASRVIDDFDDVEGAGASLRESFGGGRGSDSFEDVFTQVGLSLKD